MQSVQILIASTNPSHYDAVRLWQLENRLKTLLQDMTRLRAEEAERANWRQVGEVQGGQ